MNFDGALNIAFNAQHQLENLLSDLKNSGVVELLVSGASGSGMPLDAYPNVGVHLSLSAAEAGETITDIYSRAHDIIASGVRVTVFPKTPE